MAGSRARDLTGLLTSIGDTAGKFGDTGQQNVNTLRRSFAPKPDMNDSASLLRYADWARRNGYDDEAKQYMALGYRQKEKETQEAKDAALGKVMAESSDIGQQGQTLGTSGDLGGADATLEMLRRRLANPEVRKDPDAVRAIQNEMNALRNNRSDYVVANDKARVRGVVQMDQQIAALSKSDPDYAVKKANLEAARAHFLSSPETEKAYESQKLDLMEIEAKKMDAAWKRQSPAILAEMRLAGTNLDELKSIQDRHPQFASQIIAVEGTMLDLAERRKEIRAADFKIENLGPRIEREIKEIEDSDLPDPIKKQSIDFLNRAAGSLEGGKINPNSAIEAYDKARGQVDQLITNEAAAQSGVIRQREERAEINYEKAKQTTVTPTDVQKVAVSLYGNNPTEDELDKVRSDLTDELQDYRVRTAIAAGYEDPMRMDSEDKRAVTEGLKDGTFGNPDEVPRDVRVMRATYDLVSQGFDREDVVNFLRKELPEKERKHAEAIFDDMWTDVTSQDTVTAKPAEAASYRDGIRAVSNNQAPLITWYDRASENLDRRYQGFLERRSQTMTTRLEEVSVPVTARQKANLSPPMGRLGSQDSKLRDARQAQQPTGEYPYPGGVTAQPLSQDYIYPAYRGLGG